MGRAVRPDRYAGRYLLRMGADMTDATNPSAKTGEPVACPFCGGKAHVVTGMVEFIDAEVTCTECAATGANQNDGATQEENAAAAIAAWNTRTHPQPSLSVGLDREAVARIVRGSVAKGRPVDPYMGPLSEMGWACWTVADAILAAYPTVQPLGEDAQPYAWALVNGQNDIIQRRDQMHPDFNLLTDEDLISEGWEPLYALAAPAEGWQGTETAPKDGTWIVAIRTGEHPFGGTFAPQTCRWDSGQWEDSNGGDLDGFDPSHWMPLPAAPTGETGA